MRAMMLRQSGLAHSGRPPEDQRASIVALDLNAQRLARPENVVLPDELVQCAGTHAVGQRAGLVAGFVTARDVLEEAHGSLLCRAASYKTIDAAMPAFSDSTRDDCGMATISSACACTSFGRPEPSFPNITRHRSRGSRLGISAFPCATKWPGRGRLALSQVAARSRFRPSLRELGTSSPPRLGPPSSSMG